MNIIIKTASWSNLGFPLIDANILESSFATIMNLPKNVSCHGFLHCSPIPLPIIPRSEPRINPPPAKKEHNDKTKTKKPGIKGLSGIKFKKVADTRLITETTSQTTIRGPFTKLGTPKDILYHNEPSPFRSSWTDETEYGETNTEEPLEAIIKTLINIKIAPIRLILAAIIAVRLSTASPLNPFLLAVKEYIRLC